MHLRLLAYNSQMHLISHSQLSLKLPLSDCLTCFISGVSLFQSQGPTPTTEEDKQQQTGFIYIVTTQLHSGRFGLVHGLENMSNVVK